MSAKLQRIFDIIDEQVHRMDLDRDDLGKRAMDLAVDSILEDMDAERAPDGSQWDDLSEAYEARKARIAPGRPMAVLHGKMKDRDQLEGERVIEAHRASMTYGKDAECRIEAEWFQEGDPGQNRPARRFYGLSAAAIARQDEFFAARAEGKI